MNGWQQLQRAWSHFELSLPEEEARVLALGLVATGARLDHEAWARGLFTTKYRALAQSTQDNSPEYDLFGKYINNGLPSCILALLMFLCKIVLIAKQ